MKPMSQAASAITRTPAEIVRLTPVSQAPNGICYARAGEVTISDSDLDRMIAAVPVAAASALSRKAYYFVPLTVSQGDDTVIADRYDVALSDNAVCHRNLNLGDAQCVFISTRLMDDKFSVAFEFYINVGHALVERAGVSQPFAEMVWQQVESGVKEKPLWTRGSRASWPQWRAPKPRKSRTSTSPPPSPTRFRSTFSRSVWTWTTTTCENATILCWRPRLWRSGFVKLRKSSPQIPDSNSTFTTSGAAQDRKFRRS